MTIAELQKWVSEDWKQRSNHTPTVELQLLYIIEELGEVAEAIRKTSGSKARKNKEVNLGSELADLIVSITTLSNHFGIDLNTEIEEFKTRIEKRHKAGF